MSLGRFTRIRKANEISLLLRPGFDLFGRSVEKLVPLSAGIAGAAFTQAAGVAAHFDSRLWLGTSVSDVADYFSWRQSDAARCALNGWSYWTLRKAGRSAPQATQALEGMSTSAKHELLFAHGINFNDVPVWQSRGIGFRWETYERAGFDPIRGVEVAANRRRIRIERELPIKDAYRRFIESMVSEPSEG